MSDDDSADLASAQAISTAMIYAGLIGDGVLGKAEGVALLRENAGVLAACKGKLSRSIGAALSDYADKIEAGPAPFLRAIDGGKVD